MSYQNKQPLVSVVIPVYNDQRFLRLAVNSIVGQTYKNLEILIVNDCSTDQTNQIISELKKRDERVKEISIDENRGIANALNCGFNHSKGEFIARMDSDDVALPNRIEVQLNQMLHNPKLDILGSAIFIIDSENKIIGKRSYPRSDRDIRSSLYYQCPFAHPSVVFRKRILKEPFIYSTEYLFAEDYELWLRLSSKGYIFENQVEPLICYRLRESSGKREKYVETQGKNTLSALMTHAPNENKKFPKFKSFQVSSIQIVEAVNGLLIEVRKRRYLKAVTKLIFNLIKSPSRYTRALLVRYESRLKKASERENRLVKIHISSLEK